MLALMGRELPHLSDGLTSVQRKLTTRIALLTRGRRPPAIKTFQLLEAVWKEGPTQRLEEIFSELLQLIHPMTCRYPVLEGRGFWGDDLQSYPAAPYYSEVGPRMDPLGSLAPALRLLCNGARSHTGRVELLGEEGRHPPKLRPPGAWDYSLTGRHLGGKLVTFFPSHHRKAIVAALIDRLERGRLDQARILDLVGGPDFAWGGRLLNPDVLPEMYETGCGVLELCPLIRVESVDGGRRQVRLTGPSYGVVWSDYLPDLRRRHDTGIDEIVLRSDEKGLLVRLGKMSEAAWEACLSNLKYFTTRRLEIRMLGGSARPRLLGLRDLVESATENVVHAAGSKRLAIRRLSKVHALDDPRRTVLG
jgi:hypothetical protein